MQKLINKKEINNNISVKVLSSENKNGNNKTSTIKDKINAFKTIENKTKELQLVERYADISTLHCAPSQTKRALSSVFHSRQDAVAGA